MPILLEPDSGGTSIPPLELSGLVGIGSREYAGQVPETQAWHGGWNCREEQPDYCQVEASLMVETGFKAVIP